MTLSTVNAARALCEYTSAAVELERARIEGRTSTVRPAEVIELARLAEEGTGGELGQIATGFADNVITDRLLAKHRSSKYTPEARSHSLSLMDKGRAIIGNELADSIIHFVDAALGRPSKTEDRGSPMVYHGVWKDDATYNRGATVTLNGRLWHCEGESITERPGTSPGWKMMHKSVA